MKRIYLTVSTAEYAAISRAAGLAKQSLPVYLRSKLGLPTQPRKPRGQGWRNFTAKDTSDVHVSKLERG